jgi:hypothetical protein
VVRQLQRLRAVVHPAVFPVPPRLQPMRLAQAHRAVFPAAARRQPAKPRALVVHPAVFPVLLRLPRYPKVRRPRVRAPLAVHPRVFQALICLSRLDPRGERRRLPKGAVPEVGEAGAEADKQNPLLRGPNKGRVDRKLRPEHRTHAPPMVPLTMVLVMLATRAFQHHSGRIIRVRHGLRTRCQGGWHQGFMPRGLEIP